jgi:hypothetical protein
MLGRERRRSARPRIPARFAQTYTMLAPPATHRRRATCAEVDCPNLSRARCEAVSCPRFDNGWKTVLHARQVDLLHLARTSDRRFLERPPDEGGIIEFVFMPGQQCFESPHWAADAGPCQVVHTVSLDRPGIYRVRGGRSLDFGGRSDLWAEHWAGHADRVNRVISG